MTSELTGRFYDLTHARNPVQLAQMVELERDGICIFCPENFGAGDRKLPLLSTNHWHLLENAHPYNHTKYHLLLVPNLHVTDVADMSTEAAADLPNAIRLTKALYNVTSYGLASRNGDPVKTGGTIRHLHWHFIVGDGIEPVRIKLAAGTK